MKIYEPAPGAPDTAFKDNWPPLGDYCVTDSGEFCVFYDPEDLIMGQENWCVKHEAKCQLDDSARPAKLVKCRVNLPSPAGLAGERS